MELVHILVNGDAPVLCSINISFISICSGFHFNSLTSDLLYHSSQMRKHLLII